MSALAVGRFMMSSAPGAKIPDASPKLQVRWRVHLDAHAVRSRLRVAVQPSPVVRTAALKDRRASQDLIARSASGLGTWVIPTYHAVAYATGLHATGNAYEMVCSVRNLACESAAAWNLYRGRPDIIVISVSGLGVQVIPTY